MQFEKKSVRLGDIRPSEQNPREDFGDIGALARSIEATGGEPLNPPVVVADGNVFRIVDGERRYRALSSIYGEDREVSALVADTMDEANELVAMLATDDKRQLTEAERARGVQQMLVLGIDEQRIERASRATTGQIRAARKLRGRIDAGVQVTLEQLEAASSFDDEKDVEAVLAAGEGWADKADRIRRRIEREEAKAEDYDAFGDADIPVAKEKPEVFVYKDWAHPGLVAAKLEAKEFAAGTVAVWNDYYWEFFAPKGGEDAEPEKTEEEIRAEQEAEREEAALEDMYGRMVDFTADGAFVVCDGIARHVLENRIVPVGLSDTMGEERLQQARDRFMARLGATDPGKYEAGCSLMRIAKNMAQLNSSYCGDDAEGWIEHWNVFRAAGFTPNDEDEWLRARVQESFKEERMSSEEDENYVTVTVKARGREYSLCCRNAVVVTARADGSAGPALHIGDLDQEALPVLADRAVSELLSFGIRVGVPEGRVRIRLVHAATSCGYTEEEERGAIIYNLDIDADESAKEEKDE